MTNKSITEGFKHSYSRFNKWYNDPIGWVTYYVYGLAYPMSDNSLRGSAVEYYIATKLNMTNETNEILNDIISKDITYFEKCFENFVKCLEENNIKINEKTEFQKQINIEHPELQYPINGFIDFNFEDLSIDLKNSAQVPASYDSLMKQLYKKDYPEQLSVYHHFENKPQYLLFVNDKKYNLIEVPIEDMKVLYENLISQMKIMEQIVNMYDNYLGWDNVFKMIPSKKKEEYTEEQWNHIQGKIMAGQKK